MLGIDSQDTIVLSLPCRAEYVSVARLTTSGIANRIGFDIETIEDIKVAVSEVCNRIINLAGNTDNRYDIRFYTGTDKLKICFSSNIDIIKCLFDEDKDGLGISIINAFMDEVEFCPDNKGLVFSMTKNFEEIPGNGL